MNISGACVCTSTLLTFGSFQRRAFSCRLVHVLWRLPQHPHLRHAQHGAHARQRAAVWARLVLLRHMFLVRTILSVGLITCSGGLTNTHTGGVRGIVLLLKSLSPPWSVS